MTGKCANCQTVFEYDDPHVAYGGLLWCSRECLDEYMGERALAVVETQVQER